MTFDLAAEAGKFGDEFQQLLDAVLPYEDGTDPQLRQVTVTASRLAFAIEMGTATAKEAKTIPLLRNGRRGRRAVYPDPARRGLGRAVSSCGQVQVRAANQPPSAAAPGLRSGDAHRAWQSLERHAERGAITGLVRNNPEHSGELSKLHLPVGGVRMRPCLEDLLQLLIEEFRFDSMPNALQVIEDGRVRWRRRQLAAMVRDDPGEAVRVLADELGYEVKPPASGALSARLDRLRRW